MLKRLVVKNTGRQDLRRGGKNFPAGREIPHIVDDESGKYLEIKAAVNLRIMSAEPYEFVAVTKVTEDSAVTPVEIAEKVDVVDEIVTPVDLPDTIITDAAEAPATADTTIVIDATAANSETVTEPEKDSQDLFSCPYCDTSPKARLGMYSHVRAAHNDKYDEYKAKLKES